MSASSVRPHSRRRRLGALTVVCTLVVTLVVLVGPGGRPPSAGADAPGATPIRGTSNLTAEQMWLWFLNVPGRPAYRASVPIQELAQLFFEEGYDERVRGDIAFAQSVLETAWFNFPDYGQVRPIDNNFAGIGACNSCEHGEQYANARLGVRAQIQHLRNYADASSRSWNLAHPAVRGDSAFNSFFYKGAAPTLEGLNGKWAYPGTTYAQSILRIYADMTTWSGVGPFCPPDVQPGSPESSGSGYWMTAPDGGVFAYGGAGFYGSTGGMRLNQPIVGMAATASGRGYWLVARDGGIFSFGDARFFGSTGDIVLNQPVVGMAATPSGDGYWLVASDGGIFSFGDAVFHGSTGAIPLVAPIVAMSPSEGGDGYWMVARDGGVFAFGDAPFLGSAAGTYDSWTMAMAATPSGGGYWLVSLRGEVRGFGDAVVGGDLRGCNRWVNGIRPSPTGNGYWLVSVEGRVAVFGDAAHYGWPYQAIAKPFVFAELR